MMIKSSIKTKWNKTMRMKLKNEINQENDKKINKKIEEQI